MIATIHTPTLSQRVENVLRLATARCRPVSFEAAFEAVRKRASAAERARQRAQRLTVERTA